MTMVIKANLPYLAHHVDACVYSTVAFLVQCAHSTSIYGIVQRHCRIAIYRVTTKERNTFKYNSGLKLINCLISLTHVAVVQIPIALF